MQFQELLVVEKPVFHKHFLSILTVKLLFMLDVDKEETKWLKFWNNFLC